MPTKQLRLVSEVYDNFFSFSSALVLLLDDTDQWSRFTEDLVCETQCFFIIHGFAGFNLLESCKFEQILGLAIIGNHNEVSCRESQLYWSLFDWVLLAREFERQVSKLTLRNDRCSDNLLVPENFI